jgi:iron complex outermembrane recepter protein
MSAGVAGAANDVETLAAFSLEELANAQVTSVSKSAEMLRDAPSSIYVITNDEIRRSGVTTIPDALRLAPNLQISQYTSNRYIAGARGLAGAEEAQNFSNKLLILIDGRSVYSPLYSGVYLDVQDVILQDIDRIEVISGPGATLWGANAMNGVINIITRPAYLTQGTSVVAAAGTHERNASIRLGSKASQELAYRFYAKGFERDAMELQDGSSAGDKWHRGQLGFRMDWTGVDDTFTAQGDAYTGDIHQGALNNVDISGYNALGRWQHRTGRGEWQVQAYIDQTKRAQPADGVAFDLHSYDIEIQQQLQLGETHRLVWGAGSRRHEYEITNSASLLFVPPERDLSLHNVFVEDTVSLTALLELTIGLKLEDSAFSGWAAMPDVRLGWRFAPDHLLWTAASRAIRSATPFDVDVVERVDGINDFLVGNPDFDPEQVDAYQLGYRGQVLPDLWVSAAAFYNVHEDLRTIEPAAGTFVPLRWDNFMEGETYGLELWAKWQVTNWWRLSPGVRLLRKRLEFSTGASQLLGLAQSGNDPRSQALLTSSMDLAHNVTLDATLRYVDDLPSPALPSYHELNASLAWHASESLELSVSGFNLLDSRHQEYVTPAGAWISRSVLALARWRF